MPSSVFISYSRCNRPFAERLQIDLRRAGLEVWLDLSDIWPGEKWETLILPAITERSHLVLLASPEAMKSTWVQKEVVAAERLGKTVVPLRLAGKRGTLPAHWEQLHMIENAATDYWDAVRRLATALQAPRPMPRSLTDLLNLQQGTVADAAKELDGEPSELYSDGRRFLKLPVAPSGYGMTWLFAPPEARMQWPESLGVLFNFTSAYPGSRHQESLKHWSAQVGEPWLLMVEGPVNRDTKKYELQADQPHEWDDSLHAGCRAIEEFAKRCNKVGYYFNYLLPLAFEIGLRSTMSTPRRRVYHYNSMSESKQAGYELAFDRW